MITLYGIPNCDTVRKARRWLDSHAIDYRFHDFREQGLTTDTASSWLDELGWEKVRESPQHRVETTDTRPAKRCKSLPRFIGYVSGGALGGASHLCLALPA